RPGSARPRARLARTGRTPTPQGRAVAGSGGAFGRARRLIVRTERPAPGTSRETCAGRHPAIVAPATARRMPSAVPFAHRTNGPPEGGVMSAGAEALRVTGKGSHRAEWLALAAFLLAAVVAMTLVLVTNQTTPV